MSDWIFYALSVLFVMSTFVVVVQYISFFNKYREFLILNRSGSNDTIEITVPVWHIVWAIFGVFFLCYAIWG